MATEKRYEIIDYEIAEENMTLNDVVETLIYIKRGYIGDYNFTGDEDDLERYKLQTAMSKAIEVVKKAAESEGKE